MGLPSGTPHGHDGRDRHDVLVVRVVLVMVSPCVPTVGPSEDDTVEER